MKTKSQFAPIKGLQPLTQTQVSALVVHLGFGALHINWDKIDYDLGTGILDDTGRSPVHVRCIWTTNGHRIRLLSSRSGSVVAFQSQEVDPFYARLKKRIPEAVDHRIFFDLQTVLDIIKKEAEDENQASQNNGQL